MVRYLLGLRRPRRREAPAAAAAKALVVEGSYARRIVVEPQAVSATAVKPPPGPRWMRLKHGLFMGLVPPPTVLKELAQRYGDTFRLPWRGGGVTYTGDPEAVRAIYTADPNGFDVWGVASTRPVFGAGSVAVTCGERHRRDRQVLAPVFQGNLHHFGHVIVRAAHAESACWGGGNVLSMLAAARAMTLDIIIQVIFGISDPGRVAATRRAVRGLIDSIHPALLMFPALRRDFAGLGLWARNQRAVAALNAILTQEIRARRGHEASDASVLGRLVGARDADGNALQEADLLDQLRGILFAGHETSASVLAWILHELGRESGIQARLAAEVGATPCAGDPHALADLPYLEAVCSEGLRLYPPVVDPARIPRAPFRLLDFKVPAGEAIRPSPLLVHQRPDLYPDPERFDPERFLTRKFSKYEYIPFGGGGRRCLGGAFAFYELKILVGTLVREFRLVSVHRRPLKHVRLGLTFGPEGEVPMLAVRRRPGARAAAAWATS